MKNQKSDNGVYFITNILGQAVTDFHTYTLMSFPCIDVYNQMYKNQLKQPCSLL